jgi:hypothetical protein
MFAGQQPSRSREYPLSDTECSWEEFKKYASELTQKAREENETVLFRGQSSSDWRLETTLERSENTAEVADYFRMILRIKSEVEAYTSQKWDEQPSIYDLEPKLLSGYDSFSLTMSMGDFPHYSYMAFLRHHGFPSPLLDWSASSIVAAFFAFRTPPPTDHVAIFAFRERDASGVKEGGSGEPAIRRLGPYVAGPKRHFAQRSQYTICTRWEQQSPSFYDHTRVCRPYDPKAEFQQDMLFKFILPSDQRKEVLTELANYNLNAFTLFGSEEGLLEALSIREAFD